MEDFWEESFKGSPFEDLFGKSNKPGRPKEDSDSERTKLFRTFTVEVKNRNREYLEYAVIKHQSIVFERKSDMSLLQAYALASLFIRNIPLAYESLELIENPNSRQKQAMGIIAYELGSSFETIEHLGKIKDRVAPARIVYSLALYNFFQENPNIHQEILQPLLEKSSLANTILGTLYFNSENMKDAEVFFEKAVELAPNSERNQLNLMRTKLANNNLSDEIFSHMNEFYIQTGSTLSADEIQKELEKRKLEIPKFKIKNLFSIVSNLITE